MELEPGPSETVSGTALSEGLGKRVQENGQDEQEESPQGPCTSSSREERKESPKGRSEGISSCHKIFGKEKESGG